jgi:hypothetical protein
MYILIVFLFQKVYFVVIHGDVIMCFQVIIHGETLMSVQPSAMVNIAFQCPITHHIALNEVQ